MAISANYAGQVQKPMPRVNVVSNMAERQSLAPAIGDLVYVANDGAGTWGMYVWIGAGWTQISAGDQPRYYKLTASVTGSPQIALDGLGNSIEHGPVEFYEIKMRAEDALGNLSTRRIHGVISGTDVARVDDILQDDLAANITVTTNGSALTIICADPGIATEYVLQTTLTRVKD